ncbi:hypothetical protein BC831DRAFT_445399, partial [Entophlyctis helioformis]
QQQQQQQQDGDYVATQDPNYMLHSDETMTLVVKSSDVLPVGGCIGRDHHAFERRLRIKEMDVSRFHASIYLGEAGDVGDTATADAATGDQSRHSRSRKRRKDSRERRSGRDSSSSSSSDDSDSSSRSSSSHRKSRSGDTDLALEEGEILAQGQQPPLQQHQDAPQAPQRRPFCVVDAGSTHGTFLNDRRLSKAKVASKPSKLEHGDRLRVGSTVMVVHQHTRWSCDECKVSGGNVIISTESQASNGDGSGGRGKPQAFTKALKEAARLSELNRLKRMYMGRHGATASAAAASTSKASATRVRAEGLGATETPPDGSEQPSIESVYQDRAAIRRAMHSASESRRLSLSRQAPEAVRAVSVPEPGATATVGADMLRKMGWTEGKGLGADGLGRRDPVAAQVKANRHGLGFGGASHGT